MILPGRSDIWKCLRRLGELVQIDQQNALEFTPDTQPAFHLLL